MAMPITQPTHRTVPPPTRLSLALQSANVMASQKNEIREAKPSHWYGVTKEIKIAACLKIQVMDDTLAWVDFAEKC